MPKLNVIACLTLTTSLLAGLCHASEYPMNLNEDIAFREPNLSALKQTYVSEHDFPLVVWERVLALWPQDLEVVHDPFFDALKGLGRLGQTCQLFHLWITPFLNQTQIDERLHATSKKATWTGYLQEVHLYHHWGNHFFNSMFTQMQPPKELIIHFGVDQSIRLPSFKDATALETLRFDLAHIEHEDFFEHLSYDGPNPLNVVISAITPPQQLLKRLTLFSQSPNIQNLRYDHESRQSYIESSFSFHKGFIAHTGIAAEYRARTLSAETRLEPPYGLFYPLWQEILRQSCPDLSQVYERGRRDYPDFHSPSDLSTLFSLNLTSRFFYAETYTLTATLRNILNHKALSQA